MISTCQWLIRQTAASRVREALHESGKQMPQLPGVGAESHSSPVAEMVHSQDALGEVLT